MELLWVSDRAEATQEQARRTRLWDRWSNREDGACPFGISLRPDVPASQATIVGLTPYSLTIFTSIEAKPKIALVGTPVEVAIDSGSAKKAR